MAKVHDYYTDEPNLSFINMNTKKKNELQGILRKMNSKRDTKISTQILRKKIIF